MPEYIEREALIEKISSISITIMGVRSGRTLFNEALKSYREAVLKNIKEAPTADVDEVRHGEWIKRTEHLYKCSLCGNSAFMSLGGIPCNYCPECGAKMDGKEVANSG